MAVQKVSRLWRTADKRHTSRLSLGLTLMNRATLTGADAHDTLNGRQPSLSDINIVWVGIDYGAGKLRIQLISSVIRVVRCVCNLFTTMSTILNMIGTRIVVVGEINDLSVYVLQDPLCSLWGVQYQVLLVWDRNEQGLLNAFM